MPITILTGLPGSGKSARLIERVNDARSSGREGITFACSDSPQLRGRTSLSTQAMLCCREPGLTCDLTHFAGVAATRALLDHVPAGALVAFDESQYYGLEMTDAWIAAADRGVEVLLATPTPAQLERLLTLGAHEERLTSTCQDCGAADASTFVRVPSRDATLALCAGCHRRQTRSAKEEILDRLRDQPPYPGEEATYQPIELPECSGWRVLRPDSQRRFAIMRKWVESARVSSTDRQPTYLDIGCNTGFFCHSMRRIGFFAEGADVVRGDVIVAELLDSFFRRDHNKYVVADAYDYLEANPDQKFDVTSAFSVIQWVMIQKSDEHGVRCLERLFEKTRRVCFLEMGDASEAHYQGRVGIKFDNDWTRGMMLDVGKFDEVHEIRARDEGVKRDFFVGIRSA